MTSFITISKLPQVTVDQLGSTVRKRVWRVSRARPTGHSATFVFTIHYSQSFVSAWTCRFVECSKLVLSFLYTSYQALQAGYVAGVYRNRIVKTVLGICKVFSNFENATTLQRKQDKVFRGSKVLTRTKHRLVTAPLGKSYSGFLAIC